MNWVIGIGIALGIVLLPLIVACGLTWEWTGFAKGENNAWISFWGSYLGGLISGVITFAGVYFGFKLQDNKNKQAEEKQKTTEILKNYGDVFTVYMWCVDIVKYLDGNREWDYQVVCEITNKARDSYSVFLMIDVDWYRRFQAILANGTIDNIEYSGLEIVMAADKGRYKKLIEDFRKELTEYIKIRN